MTRLYSKGDRVKITGNSSNRSRLAHCFPVGERCTVTGGPDYDGDYVLIAGNGESQFVYGEDFEPLDRIPCDDEQREPHTEGAI